MKKGVIYSFAGLAIAGVCLVLAIILGVLLRINNLNGREKAIKEKLAIALLQISSETVPLDETVKAGIEMCLSKDGYVADFAHSKIELGVQEDEHKTMVVQLDLAVTAPAIIPATVRRRTLTVFTTIQLPPDKENRIEEDLPAEQPVAQIPADPEPVVRPVPPVEPARRVQPAPRMEPARQVQVARHPVMPRENPERNHGQGRDFSPCKPPYPQVLKGLFVADLEDGSRVGSALEVNITAGGHRTRFPGDRYYSNYYQIHHTHSSWNSELQIAAREAYRMMEARNRTSSRCFMSIGFEDKYTKKDGGSAGAAFGALFCSVAEGIELDPTVAITGDISATGKVLPIGAVSPKIRGAIADHASLTLIPKENALNGFDYVLDHGTNGLWATQVLAVDTIDEILRYARKNRSSADLEAFKQFAALRQQVATRNGVYANDSEIINGLKDVLAKVPHHLSAAILLKYAERQGAFRYTLEGSMERIAVIAHPLYKQLSPYRSYYQRNPTYCFEQLNPDSREMKKIEQDLNLLSRRCHSDIEIIQRDCQSHGPQGRQCRKQCLYSANSEAGDGANKKYFWL